MFIKKLYQYNKTAAIIFILFVAAFLFINYKWGITATPIQQFGMYSSPVHTTDTQKIYIVVADNEIVDCSKLSLTERDILQIYPANYEKYKLINSSVYNTLKKYMAGMREDTYAITDTAFTKWYKAKVQTIVNKPVQTLQVYQQNFLWRAGALQPIDSPYKLKSIVSE